MTDYSLLPDNKSPLERGLELAFTTLLYDIKNPYPSLLDAKKTPEKVLPYIANDKGVIGWGSYDTDDDRRNICSLAWVVRRYAGTKYGIRSALSSMGFESEITSWHESNGSPYELAIRVFAESKPINQNVSKEIAEAISQSVSERDVTSITVALSSKAYEHAHSSSQCGYISESYPFSVSELSVDQPLHWSGSFFESSVSTVYPEEAVSLSDELHMCVSAAFSFGFISEVYPAE